MNLEKYLERRQKLVDAALDRCFPLDPQRPHRIIEAMRYSLLSPGKRIRPILTLATAEALGGRRDLVLPFACAIEMIHTYSLIHDDLPAMDDDAVRRGRPTNHVVFGEGFAILAGDGLLTAAFSVMSEAASMAPSPRRAVLAIQEIADAAGVYGMVGGQAADLEAEGKVADLPTVEFIHVRKTGALILAAVRVGAILSGARATELRHLTRYGEFLGLAFQVADDILDLEGEPSVTGKARGRDHARRKATFPSVLGLSAAKQRAKDLVDNAVAELNGFSRKADPLRDVARFIVGRVCDGGAPSTTKVRSIR